MTIDPNQPNRVRAPDFLCVGAQKAGTTWLFDVLRDSSGVFVPAIKESNYFLEAREHSREWACAYRLQQVEEMRSYYRNWRLALRDVASIFDQIEHLDSPSISDEWYGRVFGYARDEEVAGEVCPSYLSMPLDSIEHAVRLNSDLKVLVLVRDPVDRFWSQVRMNARYGRIPQPVDELLEDERARHIFMTFSDYAGSLERWAACLKPGNLRPVVYDDISRRPRELAYEILRFLGAQTGSARRYGSRVNVGQKMPMSQCQRARILELMRPQYEYLRGIFPLEVDAWLTRHHLDIKKPGRLSA